MTDAYKIGVQDGIRLVLAGLRPTPSHVILSRLKAVPARNRGMKPTPASGWAAEFDRRRMDGELMPDVYDCMRAQCP